MGQQTIVAKAVKQVDAKLKVQIGTPLPPPPLYTKGEGDMVARLRELAVPVTSLGKTALAKQRRSLIVTVAEYLERQARAARTKGSPEVGFWVHLDTTPEHVAGVFVDMVAANPKGVLSNLPRAGKEGVGREGEFNGWLFQRYVMHHKTLHADLRLLAVGHVQELNARLAVPASGLIDVQGEALTALGGEFRTPRLAQDFWLSAPRTAKSAPKLEEVDLTADQDWDEWMDGAYVSPLLLPGKATGTYWTIGTGLEVKRPGAASKFSRQLGSMLGRLTESDVVKMTLPDRATPLVLPARAFVFLPDSRWLVGATRTLTGVPQDDYVFTRAGGAPETYLRMRIQFDTTGIDRLSTLLFRAVL